MKKIRVLIVEDSSVIRQLLVYVIGCDPRLEIVAAVETAEEALRILHRVAPDVISMDIRLPGMNGFEATRRIMQERPTPVVVVSASVESADIRITMNALQAGALTVLEKPVGVTSKDYEAVAERLCTQLVIMSQVKVVRRRAEASASQASHVQTSHLARSGWRALGNSLLGNSLLGNSTLGNSGEYKALGIVTSTGGPNALVQVLGGLGSNFPLPIFLVQHITGSFLAGFAAWLSAVTRFAVTIVENRVPLVAGTIYMAGQDRHLVAAIGFARADGGAPVCAHRPSGTVLFDSMAAAFGNKALGLLLTGMGEDGAAGLLRLRHSGAWTIAEDESTAIVYGMPAEAVRLGGVCESLPLPAIAGRLLELVPETSAVAG